MSVRGSAYGAGSPTYDDADLQKQQIKGRLKVAQGIAQLAKESGNTRRATAWQQVADELLDRLLEVRGR